MFEIKYDRDGQPLRNQAPLVTEPEPEPVQAAPEEQQEPEEVQEHVEEQETEQAEPVAQQAEAPKPVPDDSVGERSFKEIREAKKRAERERDEYMRRVAELEARQQAAKPEPVEEDEELQIGADDLAEGKHLSKVDKRAQKKIKDLEDRLNRYEESASEKAAEAQLRSKYSDFDKVVSKDNIDLLTEAYPELARSIYATDDLYTKAVSAYTLIKKFGIYQESPFASEKAVALKNVVKPRPLTSVSPQQGEGALTRANAFASGLTDELKSQLLKEMQSARKGY